MNKNDATLVVRLPKTAKAKLKEIAKSDQRDMSNMVRKDLFEKYPQILEPKRDYLEGK